MLKKRMALTLAVVLTAALMLSSGPALAQVIGGAIQCEGTPCVATGAH